MCACIVDEEQVALIDLRKHTVDRKLIVVLAEGTCDIVLMVAGLVLFSHNRDMVISAVHSRAHQVYRAGVDADVLLIGMLLMDRSCHESTVRGQHEASKLCEDRHVTHSCRNKNFLVNLSYALTDDLDIIRLLVRSVRDTDSAGEVDELDISAGLLL